MDQLEKPQVSGSTKQALAVVALVVALIFVAAFIADNRGSATSTPSLEAETRSVLNGLWVDMDTGERIDFCTEARAAGYEVVVSELVNARPMDRREARYWLEDRCG